VIGVDSTVVVRQGDKIGEAQSKWWRTDIGCLKRYSAVYLFGSCSFEQAAN
jgi:hypothetical protein